MAERKKVPQWVVWLLALSMLALVAHDLFGEHGYLAMRRSRQELEERRQELQTLIEQNKKLAEEVKALKSDPRMIEKVAREQLKLARPGEVIYTLPESPKPGVAPETQGPKKRSP